MRSLRAALIVLALGVALYFGWCAIADTPSHWSARILLAIVILGGPIMTAWERRTLS